MEAWELLDHAESLPVGEPKVALLERVIDMADADKDTRLGITARLEYASVTGRTGASDRSLVAMAWLDKRFEQSPEDFDDWLTDQFLWEFKVMCTDLVQYPQISKSRIERFVADFERRVGPDGATTVDYIKMRNLTEMGDLAAAEKMRQKFKRTRRGNFDDCEACVTDFQVLLLVLQDRPEEALNIAEPILKGELRCNSAPDSTYMYLLCPWLETGQQDLAEEKLQRIRKRLRRDPSGWVYNRSFVLDYYARSGNKRSGIPFLESSLGEALADHAIDNKALFCTAAVRMLHATNPDRTMRLARQPNLDLEDMAASDLRDKLHTIASKSAAALDARNGNRFFSERLAAANESVL